LKFINNPFDVIIKAVEELYPSTYALIQFNPELRGIEYGECGCTNFPKNSNEEILIDISTNIPFEHMVEILAHELAHVIVGICEKDDHGEKWQNVFEAIHVKYEELIDLAEKEFDDNK